MAAYQWVNDFAYLQADCQVPRSAPERYACLEYETTFSNIQQKKVPLVIDSQRKKENECNKLHIQSPNKKLS